MKTFLTSLLVAPLMAFACAATAAPAMPTASIVTPNMAIYLIFRTAHGEGATQAAAEVDLELDALVQYGIVFANLPPGHTIEGWDIGDISLDSSNPTWQLSSKLTFYIKGPSSGTGGGGGGE